MSIKGSYILFFKRNTSNYLEFFIIDCYAGIRLPDSNTSKYREITNMNTLGHSDPVVAIENYYSTRTIGSIINRSNIGTICYGHLNVYVSPNYERDNMNSLDGRTNDDFNFTNLPGGGFEQCDNSGTTVTHTPQLKNACRESSEELGIDKDRLQDFFINNTSRINIVYHNIIKRGISQRVFLFIVDLDKIEYENPDQDYQYVREILNNRITNPESIPQVTPPHVNEYYRARWVSEVDIIRAGKVYTDKFKTEFDNLIRSSIQRDLLIAKSTWTQYAPPPLAVPAAPAWGSQSTTRTLLGLSPLTTPLAAAAAAAQLELEKDQQQIKLRKGDQLLALLTDSQRQSLIPYINDMIVDKKKVIIRRIYNAIEKYLESIQIFLRDEDELINFTNELLKHNPLNRNIDNIKWKQKYLKYKQKYLELKKQLNQN
jgi:8-oxo-dGTP pyrophosphatase MutT (NUDIX family)